MLKRLIGPLRRQIREDQLTRLLAAKASGDIVIKGMGLVAILAMNAVLARLLGVEGFGYYNVTIAWVTVLALFARLGMDTGILRSVAAYTARQEYQLLAGAIRWMTRWVALSGVAAGAGLAIAVWLARDFMPPGLAKAFSWGALCVPLFALGQIFQYALMGFRRIVFSQIPELLVRPAVVITVAATLYAVVGQVSGADAVMAAAGAGAGSVALGGVLLRQALPLAARSATPAYRARDWVKTSIPLLFVASANLLLSKTDVMMLGLFATTDEAGIYAVASLLAALTAFALTALSSVAASLISEFYSTGQRAELQRMTAMIARWIVISLLPISALLIFLGPTLLAFFGPQFSAAYGPLVILVIGQGLAAFCGPVTLLLTMTDQGRVAARILTISAVGNVILNGLLIPPFGMWGAAMATASLTALRSIIMLIAVLRLVGINPAPIRLPLPR